MHQHFINCKAISAHVELVSPWLRRWTRWDEPVILREILVVLIEQEVEPMEEDRPASAQLRV